MEMKGTLGNRKSPKSKDADFNLTALKVIRKGVSSSLSLRPSFFRSLRLLSATVSLRLSVRHTERARVRHQHRQTAPLACLCLWVCKCLSVFVSVSLTLSARLSPPRHPPACLSVRVCVHQPPHVRVSGLAWPPVHHPPAVTICVSVVLRYATEC